MVAPFVYGIATDQQHFTDRKTETQRLKMNFENGINTIIISPRRWGKTSLVNYVAEQMADDRAVRIVRMDAFACRTPEDFYQLLATELIRQTYSRAEEWIEKAKHFLSSLVPIVSVSADPMNPISLSFSPVHNNYGEEVLSLSEKIAIDKGVHIVVCIDEFQQIGEFLDSLTFQKRLRSVWQLQHHTSYCLFGSKRHLLVSMFQKRSYPFYKFGDILFLERIPLSYWQEYISGKFAETQKHIDSRFISAICDYVDGNSSYVQQLAWIVWSRTEKEVSDDIMQASKSDLLIQNHALFYEQLNNLTAYQIHFLMALLAGKASVMSQKETIEEFGLGSSANVAVIKKALLKKELIDVAGKEITFADPLMPHWLRLTFKQ